MYPLVESSSKKDGAIVKAYVLLEADRRFMVKPMKQDDGIFIDRVFMQKHDGKRWKRFGSDWYKYKKFGPANLDDMYTVLNQIKEAIGWTLYKPVLKVKDFRDLAVKMCGWHQGEYIEEGCFVKLIGPPEGNTDEYVQSWWNDWGEEFDGKNTDRMEVTRVRRGREYSGAGERLWITVFGAEYPPEWFQRVL